MLRTKREYVVVSVGGSLIVPDHIDTSFLKNFRELLLKEIAKGKSFFIITGGGRLSRNYQEAVKSIRNGDFSQEDSDWLGIHATRLNAQLLRSVFIEEAQSRVVKNPTKGIRGTTPIIVGAGWKPGNSTDYCAVIAAKKLGAKKLVNLSNIDYVYTADPKNPPAGGPTPTKIEKINWHDFRELIPKEWDPGLSSPFDPVAAKEAEAMKLEVAIMNGGKLEEFEKYLNGTPFAGTIIS